MANLFVFYNFTFNHESPTGQSKYAWGIREVDLSIKIQDQLMAYSNLDPLKVFNFNLTAFNPLPDVAIPNREFLIGQRVFINEDVIGTVAGPKTDTRVFVFNPEKGCAELYDLESIRHLPGGQL